MYVWDFCSFKAEKRLNLLPMSLTLKAEAVVRRLYPDLRKVGAAEGKEFLII